MNQTIAILGAGNLGLAIANGLIQASFLNDNKLIVTRRNLSALDHLDHPNISKTTDNAHAVANADVILLCVQPKQLDDLLDEIEQELIPEKHTVISVITAVTLDNLELKIGSDFGIVRAMPNTAIAVQQSMTCMSHNQAAKEKMDLVQSIFDCAGQTLVIEEDLMQSATVVCASGIAFWMRFIRATTQGGVQLGFDAEDAQRIAVQTCMGAATLLADGNSHPEHEIDKVTTPQGCTIEGLNEMEHNGLSSALIKGLVQSYNRINKMKQPVNITSYPYES